MPGKSYNAGTIFLQVVPVFGDVQRQISRQAKDINAALGDELEKGGAEAGRRGGEAVSKEMGKAGKQGAEEYAGHFKTQVRSAVKAAQKELDSLDLKTASDRSLEELDRVKRGLKDLGDTKIDIDDRKLLSKLEMLNASVDNLTKGDHGIEFGTNVQKIRGDLKRIEDMVEKTASKRREMILEPKLDTKIMDRALGSFEKKVRDTARKAADGLGEPIHRELRSIKNELEDLADAEIGIDISAEDARRQIEELTRDAHRLALLSPEIDVKLDAAKAEVELSKLVAAMNIIDGKDIDIKVDVDTGAAAAKLGLINSLFGNSDGVDASANAFRSFNIRVLAAVTLLPALIPIVAAVGGALLALVPIMAAVGAGMGAMFVGFSGIGDAVGALGERADSAAQDSAAASKTMQAASYAVVDARQAVADAERNAGQASADAARAVADARRSAADAIEDAIDRQREAQEAYRDSVQDVREAEADLREARKQAVEEQAAASADTKDKIRQNALDIRDAVLATFDATNNFNAVMADGSSTAYDKEAAEVAMLQARERLHELRDTERELAKDRKKQSKEGVNDSSAVESAQDALTAALERQRDAQKAVGEAAEAVNEARIEGARQVQDALRSQARTDAEGARSVARAQEQLRRAQENYGQAIEETGKIGSASMQNLEEAMGKLGPAGRKFARFLFSLRDGFYAFRDSIQSAMLPGVQRAFETIIGTYGPQFTAFMTEMGGVVGRFFENFANSLTGPAWSRFFGIMEEIGPKMAAQFGDTTINWLETFANVLSAVAPFAVQMSEGMLRISEAVERWSASAKGQNTVTRFMEYAAEIGPRVLDFLGDFIGAAVALAVALAPWGTVVMDVLDRFLGWIIEMDPQTLGNIATAVVGLIIAFQAATGSVAAFFAGQSAFATVAGKIIFGVVGLTILLAALAIQFEGVRDALRSVGNFLARHQELLFKVATAITVVVAAIRVWRAVTAVALAIQVGYAAAITGSTTAIAGHGIVTRATAAATRIWMAVQKGGIVWTTAATVAQWLLNTAFYAFPLVWIIAAVAAVVVAIILLWKKNETFRAVVTKAWNKVKDAVAVAWDVIKVAVKAFGTAVMWLWKNVVKPYLGLVWTFWSNVFKGMKLVWTNILWPVFKLIGKVIWELWKFWFKPVFELLKFQWRVVSDIFMWAWKTIIKPAWDAMKDGLSDLGDKFEKTVSNIKSIWERLRKIIGWPIKFIIETVINDGLVAGFNKIAKFVGADPMTPLPVPEWTYAKGGVFPGYANGGTLPGYTPGRDVHEFYSPTGGKLNLSGGEAILRPEATMALGPSWVDGVNRAARFGGARGVQRALGQSQGYWLGGVLPLPGSSVSTHTGYSGYAADFNVGSGSDDYGMAVKAWKAGVIAAMRFNGSGPNNPSGSYGRWMDINHGGQYSRYAHLAGFAPGLAPGGKIGAGQTLGYVGSIGNSSGPHLHFEINGGDAASFAGVEGGGSVKGAKPPPSFPGWVIDIAKNPFGYVSDLVTGPIRNLRDKFGQSEFIGQMAAIPVQALKSTGRKVWDMMPNGVKRAAGVLGDAYDAGKGALTSLGNGLDAVTPGDGVPFVDSFAKGGILPYNGTMKYDAGGYLPPGITNVVNLTGKPEPVFTDDQFNDINGGGGGGFTYAPTITEANLTSEELVDDMEFTYRKLSRKGGGKYEGAVS